MTEITAKSIDEALRKQLESLDTSVDAREVGTVVQVGDGIARVDGLKGAMAGELLEFIGEGGKTVYGLAQNLEEEEVGAVLLGDVTAIRENDRSPQRACQPSAIISPSRTSTAPTSGLGFVNPVPRRASSIARRMYSISASLCATVASCLCLVSGRLQKEGGCGLRFPPCER